MTTSLSRSRQTLGAPSPFAVAEVNVFTVGDSEKLSTWSNVPYFFARSLMERGIKVNQININHTFMGKMLNGSIWRLIRYFHKSTTYNYSRSSVHFNNVRRKIARALKLHDGAGINFFMTFSFSSVGLSSKPTVLICDWTYDHYFRYFINREPDRLEKRSMAREDSQIEQADAVFVLFPGVADYMRRHYKNKNIYYLGHVVNSVIDVDVASNLALKTSSSSILFIGGMKYHQGAVALIEAFESLHTVRPELSLHIVGIKEREFDKLPAGVTCYGYLDKSKPEDRDVYYKLLTHAKVLVNTTPKWGAFSATVEAMHFCTPVVTTPYVEFVETFGQHIGFGFYCDDGSQELLCSKITQVLDHSDYAGLCLNAHESVREFTWPEYVDKMLRKLGEVVRPAASKPQ